ncbi:MAG: YfiR family protein, partial [Chlorobiales bacterium]|nr:YfiR family protein [Chlorobiales bacterium]
MLKRTRHLVVFVLILIGGTIPIQAKDSAAPISKEYKIKAAYLYNYLKTIGWPETLPPAMREHMILGILGTNPFGNNLEQLKAKTAQGKPIKVLLFGPFTALQQQQESSETTEPNHPRLQDMASCHILFVTQSETSHLPAVQEVVGTQPVLIVGED